MGNSPAVIDRFYKGAVKKAEVEKFGAFCHRTLPEGVRVSKGIFTSF